MKKHVLSSLGVAVALLVTSVGVVPAFAATTSTGLSINPRKNLLMTPGQTISDKLPISNLDQHSDLNIAIRVIDFTYTGQTGTPKLILTEDTPPTTWSLKPFINIPSSVVVPAGQTREISYSVKIPANQGAGSYYGAIEYAAQSGSGGNVNLNASGATLVFVTVAGKLHEDMRLQQFGAYQRGAAANTGTYEFLALNEPLQMGYTLKNNGNVAESPTGTINLQYMFAKEPLLISNVNATSSLVLLQQTRLFLTCIKPAAKNVVVGGSTAKSTSCVSPGLLPGFYRASLDVFYGQNGNATKEVTGTASFWYLPIWFIAAFIIVLSLIIGAIWFITLKVRNLLYGKRRR